MLRKIYLISALVFISSLAMAQTGTLKGVVTDMMSGEAIPFANIIAEKNGNQIGGTTSDFDGNYTIKPLEPGTYTLKATFVGYGTVEVTGVIVSANKITMQDVKLQEGIAIGEVEIIAYKKPLLDQDNLSGETKTSEEIVALPTRSVASVAATTAGIYQRDEGDGVNMRGSRGDATTYYIDGIKVVGNGGVPTSAIEQITVVTGGLPAKYGDATGGIISITTKGPSSKTFGGIEFESSSLFDSYNHNLLGFSLSGPLYKKRNLDGTKGNSVIGYFLSGELKSVDDSDPSAIGVWKVKDDVLRELQVNPFIPSENSDAGLLSTSEFLSASDFENVEAKVNSNEKLMNFSGKIDIKPTNNTFLSLGGSFYYTSRLGDPSSQSIPSRAFNWDNNRQYKQTTYRLFGKLTQKFGNDDSNSEESSSVIKNAFFTMQGDYTKDKRTWLDPNHQFDLFNYGYVGKFETFRERTYTTQEEAIDPETGIVYIGYIQTGYKDTLLRYTPGGINKPLENYTNAYYDLFNQELYSSYVNGYGADGVIRTADDLNYQGLLNGQLPRNDADVYSLFRDHGHMYNGAAKYNEMQFSFKAAGSADIKNHEFSFGFEYEERKESYWSMGPMNLWSHMRSLTNLHLLERDFSTPIPLVDPITGIYQDTVHYNQLYIEDVQTVFDRRLREELKFDVDGTDYIDIDSYHPSTFAITMFGEDELLNSGSSLTYYYGYDIYGNENTKNATLKDFFREGSEKLIAPYQPIYTAGYIQDKFAVEDLIFNIGLRVDRFDANQKVLKDKYLLYEAYTAGSTKGMSASGGIRPSTIGDDFVVYVDDFASSTPNTVGYRNGDVWYNADGLEISDPKDLSQAAGGTIQPYLTDKDAPFEDINMNAFEDYKPEVVFMPRLAFSFPISDEAQFFAHYDVLTQRPPSRNILEPVDYLFMADRVGALLNNPDLKPEKTIDYELGFAKTLSLRSALKISAFYKEMRDQIQVINVSEAYPAQYLTMGNVDFGTVKGMSISYDLRRTNNIQLTANYTLQFADGTGSGTTSGYNIANSGQPNLRTTNPLSFDQRHAISASVDYHYGDGKDYNGPVWFGANIFANAGANVILSAGSGTPYSRQENITKEAIYRNSERSILEGSLYGSRLPWQSRISAKINKEFEIKWSDKKSSHVNVYVQVQNLLNTKNIIYVYRATGNADDDGYLTYEVAQNTIASKNNEESFRHLYSLAVNNPSHYSLPRMWRVGLNFNF
ncbi:carboxypeptidase regulatory-like domain-containing protein [Flavobacteriales bacterium]|nr:carboxypeptidase regulatory-like domain-containing protein [Flavobacteriales bacterium]